jgi:hypothetical protein
MTSIAGLLTWFGICVTYIRFNRGFRYQGYDRKTLPYKSPLQPYAAYYGAVGTILICFVEKLSPPSLSRPLAHLFFFLAVLRLVCIPQEQLVNGGLCDQLPSPGPLPSPLSQGQVVDASADRQPYRYGL